MNPGEYVLYWPWIPSTAQLYGKSLGVYWAAGAALYVYIQFFHCMCSRFFNGAEHHATEQVWLHNPDPTEGLNNAPVNSLHSSSQQTSKYAPAVVSKATPAILTVFENTKTQNPTPRLLYTIDPHAF